MERSDEPGLERIRIQLAADAPFRFESLWAEPLGDDRYRLRNTPFVAKDLNFHDIVRATSQAPNELPSINKVVERSGHKTLRIFFADEQLPSTIDEVLRKLNEMNANYEKGKDRFYAVDVRPEADYRSVCDYLWTLQQQAVLAYETGPTREDGPDGWQSWGKGHP
jgi:hypothetical protein